MKSILVIGLGRFGRHMAQKLLEEGNDVLAVEKNEERADKAASILRDIQIGDATDEEFIASLGVNLYDMCVVAVGDNFQSALEITVLLKDMGARFILARASRDVHRKLLLRNGADHVVYAEREMAERLAVKYGAKNIFDYIELTEDIGIYEIAVPASWYGKSIVEKSIRNRYNVSILATKRNGKIYPLPPADHRFSPEETLMVMGSEADLRALVK
ncbi:potassium channel family protein [Fusibacillus kribbianus]|uniref:TrkA family potassium uptake protein n=1 Tax=Fusibacillus kribbianus TaxID=3044208 RepID=A0AAP4BCM5_9FIRM|nr:TrkA family potassium uptake protein [Ruminococcus sp. YH-rum2234]MDI9242708.1 TrkA family potassium uptake protein [Ruminococcus sp. YH-rum2234]